MNFPTLNNGLNPTENYFTEYTESNDITGPVLVLTEDEEHPLSDNNAPPMLAPLNTDNCITPRSNFAQPSDLQPQNSESLTQLQLPNNYRMTAPMNEEAKQLHFMLKAMGQDNLFWNLMGDYTDADVEYTGSIYPMSN